MKTLSNPQKRSDIITVTNGTPTVVIVEDGIHTSADTVPANCTKQTLLGPEPKPLSS